MGLSSRGWSVLACSLAAGALLNAGGFAGAQASDCGTRGTEPDRNRVEYFELRRVGDGPAEGFASLHRNDSAGGTQLEWQVSFPGDELNIWHVESSDAQGRRLVWRERQPRNARSVVADQAGAAMELTEWGGPNVLRRSLATPDLCCFPLELEERLRAGEVGSRTVTVFDPLGNEVESVRIEGAASNSEAVDGLRCVELIRADGSLAGSWTFIGRELVSFRWQRGGLIAVRVDEASFTQGKLVPAGMKPPAASTGGH